MSILHKIKEMETILSLITPAIIITPEKYPDIHSRLCELLLSIKDEYFDNVPLSEASIYARLIDMFVLLGRNHTENIERFDVGNSKHSEYTEKFLYICNYISEHCTEDLSLDEVAQLAGFSKYHFTRLFKQFANISFYKYLNQKRIAHSETLLIEPDISITEVALHSGFSSLSAFIRMFKIIKACTPTEFRNMYIGMQS
jgi:AraC-like DNA-binding protein